MFKFILNLFRPKHKYPNFKIVKTKEDLRKEKVLNEFIEKV